MTNRRALQVELEGKLQGELVGKLNLQMRLDKLEKLIKEKDKKLQVRCPCLQGTGGRGPRSGKTRLPGARSPSLPEKRAAVVAAPGEDPWHYPVGVR